jgi:hypothetical protein
MQPNPETPVALPLAAAPAPRKRLAERMVEILRRGRYSRRTEESYLMWCRQFVEFNGGVSPMRLGAPEVTAFLNHLAVARRVAASTHRVKGLRRVKGGVPHAAAPSRGLAGGRLWW